MAAKSTEDKSTEESTNSGTEAKIEAAVNAVAKKKYDFTKLNLLSLVSLGFAVIGGAVPAVVLAHISLAQIKKKPQDGRVIAIIAMVLGYIQVAFYAFGALFFIGMAIVALTQGVPLSGIEHYFEMNGWGGDFGGRGMMGW
jgi:fatty acid desaturase